MNCGPLTRVRSSVPTKSSFRSVRVEWARSIARDTRLDCDLAIKILPDAMTRDADRVARFEREAKVPAHRGKAKEGRT